MIFLMISKNCLLEHFTVPSIRSNLYLNDLELSVITSALFVGTFAILNNHKLCDVSG